MTAGIFFGTRKNWDVTVNFSLDRNFFVCLFCEKKNIYFKTYTLGKKIKVREKQNLIFVLGGKILVSRRKGTILKMNK